MILKKLIVYISLLNMQTNSLSENMLNNDFSNYYDERMVIINDENYISCGIGVKYDYYSPPEVSNSYFFMKETISKMGFVINKNKTLKEVGLFMEIKDPDNFYDKIVDKYGMPDTASLSKHYIEQHNHKIPSADDKPNKYNDLPKPKKKDFKNLKSLIWYGLNSEDSTKVTTDLILRNRTNPDDNNSTKLIEVVFKRSKEEI